MLLRARPTAQHSPADGETLLLRPPGPDAPVGLAQSETVLKRPSGPGRKRSRSTCSTRSPRCRQDAQKKEAEKERLSQLRRASASQLGGLGVLRTASVSLRTQSSYRQVYNEFLRWMGSHRDFLNCATTVDIKVAKYLDELYLDGEAMGYAQRVIAAVLFFVPVLGRGARGKLPRAAQALKGFRILDPPKARLPFPWEVVAMLANGLLLRGLQQMALGLLLMFEFYLRPGETFGVLAVGLVPPVRRQGHGSHYDLVLHPFEEKEPSKTQEFDHALSLDLERHAALGPALELMLEKRLGAGWRKKFEKEKMFTVTQTDVLKAVKKMVAEMQWDLGVVHLYRVRHAGASHDFVSKARSLEEVRRRGRWRTHQSVRRYEKGARTGQLLQRLPEAVAAGTRSPLAESSPARSSLSCTPAAGTSAKRCRTSATSASSGTCRTGPSTTF